MHSAARQCFLDLRRVGCFPDTLPAPIRPTFQHVISYPDLLKKISELLWKKASLEPFNCLAAAPSRAISFATSCATLHHIPLLAVDQDQIIGIAPSDARIALIEGVIEDPEPLLTTWVTLRNAGWVPTQVIALLVTPQAAAYLADHQVPIRSVAEWKDALHVLSPQLT